MECHPRDLGLVGDGAQREAADAAPSEEGGDGIEHRWVRGAVHTSDGIGRNETLRNPYYFVLTMQQTCCILGT